MDYNIIEEFTADIEYDWNIHIVEGEIYLKDKNTFEDYGYLYSLDGDLNLLNSYKLPEYSMGYDRTMSGLYTGNEGYEFTKYNKELEVLDTGLICNGCSEEFFSAYFIAYQLDGDKLYAMSENLITVFERDDSYHYSFEFKEKSSEKFTYSIIAVLFSYTFVTLYKRRELE